MKDLGLRKARPHVPAADLPGLLADFESILRSGVLTMGPFLERFEADFAAAIGTRHAVGMSSGTAPLEIALRHWDVAGGEVVMTTNTFMATVHAAQLAGARPVLADIDPECLSSTCAQLEPLLSEDTRAVVVVHVGGRIVPDIADIAGLCHRRGVPLLEDAAHAHGSALAGRRAGALGDAASFSFFPTKVMTTGEGGMLTTDDDELAAFARSFRCHGIGAGRLLERLGTNYRMPEMAAALGLRQLARLDETVAERQALARAYDAALREMAGLAATPVLPGRDETNAWYKYAVQLDAAVAPASVTASLSATGVPTGTLYWPPCHLQPSARASLGTGVGTCPTAERVLARVRTLPLYNGMTEADVQGVAQRLREALASA